MKTRTCLVLGWVSNTGRSPRNTADRDIDMGNRPGVAGRETHECYIGSRRNMVDDEPAGEVYRAASWAVESGTEELVVVVVREEEECSAWLQCRSRVRSGRQRSWPRLSTHPRPAR
jgi:hypothetical protein